MTITKTEIHHFLQNFSDTSPLNHVSANLALKPEYAGMRMYEHPIVGISSAEDELYARYPDPAIIGEHYLTPTQWMPGAKSVISVFHPLTQQIKNSNAGGDHPSEEWLHGRIEGQVYILAAAQALADLIHSKGAKALAPSVDERFQVYGEPKIYSNWSERHAAYASGLGTFSLNRGIITKKGIAGRFCSVITDIDLPPVRRDYTGVYDYCTLCGACLKACPVGAINQHGKDHDPCRTFLEKIETENHPRYGCGKCQSGMPCESGIPPRNPRADHGSIRNFANGN